MTLFLDLQSLNAELARDEHALKSRTIGHISESQEKGHHYEQHILSYINGLDELSATYAPRILQAAALTTETIHEAQKVKSPRQAKNYQRRALLTFASSYEFLGGRPSKKIGAALFDENFGLVEWGVNGLCYGVERNPALYTKGINGGRGYHIWCGERNVMAKELGLSAHISSESRVPEIHAELDRFTLTLIGTALAHDKMRNWTLVSSHYPCGVCVDVIAPRHSHGRIATVKEVVTLYNPATEGELTSPNRQTAQSATKLRKAGIPVRLEIAGTRHAKVVL